MSEGASIQVTPEEAAFLDVARDRVHAIGARAEEIGPRPYLSFGASWGNQFSPLYDEVQALLSEGYARLGQDSAARSAFTETMRGLNNLLGRLQTSDESAYEALVRFASASPLERIAWAGTLLQAASADARAAVAELRAEGWDPLGDLLSTVKRYAVYVVGAGALLAFAYGRGKR